MPFPRIDKPANQPDVFPGGFMKTQLIAAGCIFAIVSIFAQTRPAAPPAPSKPHKAISGFAPNPVGGFSSAPVQGFSSAPVAGFSSAPVAGFSTAPVPGATTTGTGAAIQISPLTTSTALPPPTNGVIVASPFSNTTTVPKVIIAPTSSVNNATSTNPLMPLF